ncbi:UDP-N-acetylmuramoyl-L-alanyl-D-glutamate--2,6-diaminopimelate ligase [Oceaniserpentilla sp. 4NH20-0058]|uniref:UDP-N-acetylmuramoyl-L-alanyl-D-glutamate--2, 6-diaminopimelate ligase n=1 Tax=Oceaniserpentilla sp. 4NH20-0058 TaxID=3127660 RepID=UPI003101FA24
MIQFNQPLSQLIPWIDSIPQGLLDFTINNICFDSREVAAGDAFFLLPSVAGNEQTYIGKALSQGASVILLDETRVDLVDQDRDICVTLRNPVEQAGQLIAGLLYGNTLALRAIGITGTNGKSSISFYLAQLLNELQSPCAVMGTLGYGDWQQLKPTGMTTLPSEKLHNALLDMSCEFDVVAMEVSSHGLEQNRLAGVKFEGAVFSNLTRDHLDYHGTMEAYGEAKALLFQRPEIKFAVVNADDPFSQVLKKVSHVVPLTYGCHEKSDLSFKLERYHEQGIDVSFTWEAQTKFISLPLFGAFNAENVAAAILVCLQMGFKFSDVISACSKLHPVAGRMQQVNVTTGQPLVLVDYAHTPDALEQILKSTRKHVKSGRLILVVGCGGDRDQGKRPLMGKIACQYADKVIITSDNPRSENPADICQQMIDATAGNLVIEIDRQKAIETALGRAESHDVVVIAGKGHEDYQEINGERLHFSDVEQAQAVLKLEIQA